jgi:maltooligosyltrehalose trehalohydrolase
MTGPASRSMAAWGARPALGGIRFGFWAPDQEFVDLLIEGEAKMLRLHRADDGWHVLTTTRAQAGSRYWFVLPDGARVPDPASSFQPRGVEGPSEVIDHASLA